MDSFTDLQDARAALFTPDYHPLHGSTTHKLFTFHRLLEKIVLCSCPFTLSSQKDPSIDVLRNIYT